MFILRELFLLSLKCLFRFGRFGKLLSQTVNISFKLNFLSQTTLKIVILLVEGIHFNF